ncbi:MAG: hypothetical protein H6658_05270 [Ardenticatenaceae bacterium]|nr:hypothetical protein [Ardenticatenaceae bacterium]
MFFQEAATPTASTIQLLGAGGFGAIIGWFVYFINRYRKEDVSWSDLTTIIGIIGGGAILTLFPASTDLFGAYGIGLFAGFFGYFCFLMLWVRISKNFYVDWFLDGRRKKLADDDLVPDGTRSTTASMHFDQADQGGRE